MPLESISEWRARIGSCWCILGRVMKSRCIRAESTGLKTTPKKCCMNGFLKRNNVHPWTLMLLVTALGMLSLGDYRGCLLCFLQVFHAKERNAVLVTILRAICILLLLLSCGDVEQNPGPDLDYNDVDGTIELNEDNFDDVREAILRLSPHYYNIGVQLGLPPENVKRIQAECDQDCELALRKILHNWLGRKYDVEKHGHPTWRRLVEAVNSPNGGNDQMLAKTIASSHQAICVVKEKVWEKILSDEDICTLMELLHDYCSKWSEIGLMLGFTQPELTLISNMLRLYGNAPVSFMRELLSQWIQWPTTSHPVKPTTKVLCAALRNPVVGLGRLADEIEFNSSLKDGAFSGCQKLGGLKMDTSTCFDHADTHSVTEIFRLKFAPFYLQQIDERAWPPIKTVNFITLMLIRDAKSWRRTTRTSVEGSISRNKRNITSYESLLDNLNSRRCRFILLEGKPGSGKTTLMNKISKDWGEEKIWPKKILIYVPLRRLNSERERNLKTLIKVACPELSSEEVDVVAKYINKGNGFDTVFAFDGLDEYKPHENSSWFKKVLKFGKAKDDIVYNIIRGKSLSGAKVILTSRPAACTDLRQYAGKQIEVFGFSKQQINEYIDHYFESDIQRAQELKLHLDQHPRLANMCYLPLYCAMLVFLYEDDLLLPETETEFYTYFTISTLLRSIRKKRDKITAIKSFDDLPKNEQGLFFGVCQLAFRATVDTRQVFHLSELQEVESVACGSTTKDNLGLVVKDRYFMKNGLDETYTFLHLTFQEFLAAVYISRMGKSQEIVRIVREHCLMNHLGVVWRFLCGLLKPEEVMNVFECITETSTDKLFRFHCAFESHQEEPCVWVIQSHGGGVSFEDENISPSDCDAIGYVIYKANFPITDLSFIRCSFEPEGMKALLHQIDDHQFSLKLEEGEAVKSFLIGLTESISPGLLSIDLSGNRLGDEEANILGSGIRNCVNLKDVQLKHNQIGNIGTKAIAEGLNHCKSIQCINLYSNNIGDAGGESLGNCLKDLKELKELDLSRNIIGDRGLQALIKGLKNCSKLNKLNLWSNIFKHSGIQAFDNDLMKTWISIQEQLSLDGCVTFKKREFNPSDYAAVGYAIKKYEEHNILKEAEYSAKNSGKGSDQVLHCHFISCSVDIEGAKAFFLEVMNCQFKLTLQDSDRDNKKSIIFLKGLKYYPGSALVGFHLYRKDLSHESKLVVDSLQNCVNLQVLNLAYNQLNYRSLIQIIQNLKYLKELNVDGNSIGDDGVQALATCLADHCVNLESLSLNKIGITDLSVECLKDIMVKMNCLSQLWIEENNLSTWNGTLALEQYRREHESPRVKSIKFSY